MFPDLHEDRREAGWTLVFWLQEEEEEEEEELLHLLAGNFSEVQLCPRRLG